MLLVLVIICSGWNAAFFANIVASNLAHIRWSGRFQPPSCIIQTVKMVARTKYFALAHVGHASG